MTDAAIPQAMAFRPEEILNAAIMSKVPVVIVEGHDDIPLYERIIEALEKECEVVASENLCGLEGCEGVIRVINEIRGCSGSISIEDFVLGIIDRDSRAYRGEMPGDPAILVLKHYSMESHFATEEVVRLVVCKVTGATGGLFDEQGAKAIFDIIKDRLKVLYLLSLEALKNACDSSYTSEFGYADKVREVLGRGYPSKFDGAKVNALNNFAGQVGVTDSWEDLLKICKGKWLLEIFIDELKAQLGELSTHCKSEMITKCQYCINNTFNKCLYKLNANYSSPILMQMALQEINQNSLSYIFEEINGLAVN